MFIFTFLLLLNFSINTIQNISQRHDNYLERKFNMYTEHVKERMCNDCYLTNLINLFQHSSPYINQKNRLDFYKDTDRATSKILIKALHSNLHATGFLIINNFADLEEIFTMIKEGRNKTTKVKINDATYKYKIISRNELHASTANTQAYKYTDEHNSQESFSLLPPKRRLLSHVPYYEAEEAEDEKSPPLESPKKEQLNPDVLDTNDENEDIEGDDKEEEEDEEELEPDEEEDERLAYEDELPRYKRRRRVARDYAGVYEDEVPMGRIVYARLLRRRKKNGEELLDCDMTTPVVLLYMDYDPEETIDLSSARSNVPSRELVYLLIIILVHLTYNV